MSGPIVHSISDLAKGPPATSSQPIFSTTGWRNDLPPHVYDVRSFGAIGDGVTDDTVAVQTAIDACGAGGGGTVFFPTGRYRLATSYTANGVFWCLLVGWDDVSFGGPGTLFLDLATDCALAVIGGCVKAARIAGDITNWINYSVFVGTNPAPGWNLTGTVVKGAASVTLNSAADNVHFAVGDYVAVRTGQTISATATGQPDAEINKVKSISGATINLEVPTAKGYAAENYNAGSTGISSVGGAGTAAPYQLVNVNDRIMRNFGVADLGIDTRANRHAFIGNGLDGVVFERVNGLFRGGQSFLSLGTRRGERVRDCTLTHRGLSGYVYAFGADSGSLDCRYERNQITTDAGTIYIHVHEGASQIYAVQNRLSHPLNANLNEPLVDIRGRAYDVFVLDNEFVNGSSNAGGATVLIDSLSVGGGRVAGNRYLGTHGNMVQNSSASDLWVIVSPAPARTITASTNVYPIPKLILADPTAGNITVNLVTTVTQYAGHEPQTVKNIASANNVIVNPNGSETLDGATAKTLAPRAWITYVRSGSEFAIIGQGGTVT